MAQKQLLEIPFPLLGLNENWAFGRQPEGTTPDAQNVVPFDPIDSRVRGGQRWGTSKYYSSLHNGANALQQLTSIVLSVAGGANTFTEDFTASDGYFYTRFPSEFDHYLGTYVEDDTHTLFENGVIAADNDSPTIIGNKVQAETPDSGGTTSTHIYKARDLTFTGSYSVDIDVTASVPVPDTSFEQSEFLILFRVNPEYNNEWYAVQVFFRLYGPNHATKASKALVTALLHKGTISGIDVGEYIIIASDTAAAYTALVAGVNFKVDITSAGAVSITMGAIGTFDFTTALDSYVAYTRVGFALEEGTSLQFTVDNFRVIGGQISEAGRIYNIIAVSGGDIYYGSPTGSLALAVSGENAVNTTGRVGAQSAYGDVYFVDGTNYKVFDNSNGTVTTWTANTGTLPVSGSNTARIIALYRGRIVLSGMIGDPHNWFMSAVGPDVSGVGGVLDWDYDPAITSATQAVAGNNTDAGRCPDFVTCLAPYSDDLMFIGGDHTLWLMRGDPADRGRIDNVSYQTGIAGPDAYTFDPNGVFYFFGSGTIWRMAAGGIPEPLSRNRMDKTFGDVDLTTNTVHLAWDNVRHGLFIFIVPSTEGSATHYYWDERTDSFWPITFPDAQGPTTVLAFDGDDPDDNALILGGFDGYLRKIDPLATDDDGTAINSYVIYPPIAVGGVLRNTKVDQITAVLDTNSDDVVLTVYAEDTPQKAIESSTIRFARTLSAGRTRIVNRVLGNAIMFKLSNSVDETTWAIENLVVSAEVAGLTKRN